MFAGISGREPREYHTVLDGTDPPPHRHTHEDETIVVLDGTVEAECGPDVFTATADATVFLPRGLTHTFRSVNGRTTVLFIVTPGHLHEFFRLEDQVAELPASHSSSRTSERASGSPAAAVGMSRGGTMSALFAELVNVDTPMGELSLRRRREPSRQVDVFEVKLGDEYLMSSLFTVGEIELPRLGLAALEREPLTVVVGGLGLGYTARAVLEDRRVSELLVVEALAPVVDWHEAALLPESSALIHDSRCRFIHGDFFARVRDGGFDDRRPGRRFDAILVDIDHTPSHILDPSHTDLYTEAGLRRLTRHLASDGVLGLWSDGPPDEGFVGVLERVFDDVRAEVVEFDNFLTGGISSNTVYVATGSVPDGDLR